MVKVNRNSLQDYSRTIKGLTNEELHKEIWMLDEHIKYLTEAHQDSSYFQKFLHVAREERETRMCAQGYQ